MRVLLACEESQIVTKEFRNLGVEAYSCDILPTSGDNPEWHLQQDLIPLLEEEWDLIIAFPPCTHIASSGAKHFEKKRADGRQQEGIDFFMQITKAKYKHLVIENPVGIMSTIYKKPTQIIQPWQFGDEYQKTTCLWIKNLPNLVPTDVVDKGKMQTLHNGKHSDRNKVRSKTFPRDSKRNGYTVGSLSN